MRQGAISPAQPNCGLFSFKNKTDYSHHEDLQLDANT